MCGCGCGCGGRDWSGLDWGMLGSCTAPRMVTCELSRVCRWRAQHAAHADHERESQVCQELQAAPGIFRKKVGKKKRHSLPPPPESLQSLPSTPFAVPFNPCRHVPEWAREYVGARLFQLFQAWRSGCSRGRSSKTGSQPKHVFPCVLASWRCGVAEVCMGGHMDGGQSPGGGTPGHGSARVRPLSASPVMPGLAAVPGSLGLAPHRGCSAQHWRTCRPTRTLHSDSWLTNFGASATPPLVRALHTPGSGV